MARPLLSLCYYQRVRGDLAAQTPGGQARWAEVPQLSHLPRSPARGGSARSGRRGECAPSGPHGCTGKHRRRPGGQQQRKKT